MVLRGADKTRAQIHVHRPSTVIPESYVRVNPSFGLLNSAFLLLYPRLCYVLHWQGSRAVVVVLRRPSHGEDVRAVNKLFISYRRDDAADICGRLYDKLTPRFGADNVFKDVDSIFLGTDFRPVLRDSVAQCAAMLVVIGRTWINATDQAGRQRLENPNDLVRIEVEAALVRNIPVFPCWCRVP